MIGVTTVPRASDAIPCPCSTGPALVAQINSVYGKGQEGMWEWVQARFEKERKDRRAYRKHCPATAPRSKS